MVTTYRNNMYSFAASTITALTRSASPHENFVSEIRNMMDHSDLQVHSLYPYSFEISGFINKYKYVDFL